MNGAGEDLRKYARAGKLGKYGSGLPKNVAFMVRRLERGKGFRWKESKSFPMSEIPPTNGKVKIVEEVPSSETVQTGEEKPSWLSREEKIREELGIVDGQVTLTFLDDLF
jgi:hypothetical protein